MYSWEKFLNDVSKKTSDAELQARVALIKAGHCCTLIYTSGTTGNPKAVMVSHDNIAFEAASVLHMIAPIMDGETPHEERIVSYLPLSHVAGMMVDIVRCALQLSQPVAADACCVPATLPRTPVHAWPCAPKLCLASHRSVHLRCPE